MILDYPLVHAATEDNKKYLLSLIEEGYDVNQPDDNGLPPLHWAVRLGKKENALILIANGAKTDFTDKDGRTIAHWACASTISPEYLRNYFGNLNAQDGRGETPLHWACRSGNVDAVTFLINNGCDANGTEKSNLTPLHYACIFQLKQSVKLLIKHGANVNSISNKGETALMLACRHGHTDLAKCLIKNGANAHIKNHKNATLLHAFAASNIKNYRNSETLLSLILSLGIDIESMNEDKQTALDRAIELLRPNESRLLIEKGAKINKQHLKTQLINAAENENHRMCELLVEIGADPLCIQNKYKNMYDHLMPIYETRKLKDSIKQKNDENNSMGL